MLKYKVGRNRPDSEKAMSQWTLRSGVDLTQEGSFEQREVLKFEQQSEDVELEEVRSRVGFEERIMVPFEAEGRNLWMIVGALGFLILPKGALTA